MQKNRSIREMSRNMKKCIISMVLAAVTICLTPVGFAQQAEEAVTVITSDKLTFDYKKQYALFEGSVVVTDPSMQLSADNMIIKFSADNEVQSIVAKQNVTIVHEGNKAQADIAAYDVAQGKIVLEGNPRVYRGRDILTGDKITFWREENKMICEPRARLIIYPQEGGTRQKILGAE